jgi:uncharacterized protein involved in exopolysaccharide biosynthesis
MLRRATVPKRVPEVLGNYDPAAHLQSHTLFDLLLVAVKCHPESTMREVAANRPDEIGRVEEQFVDPEPLPALALLAFFLKGWRTIAIASIAVATLFFLKAILTPRLYTVTTSLMPDARGPGPAVSGLAAQFGLPVSAGDPTQSPQFYFELLTSEEILRGVATAKFDLPNRDNRPINTLASWYEVPSSPRATDQVIKILRRSISPSVSLRTGVITASVSANHPAVAFQVASRLIDELNRFNTDRRLSRAGAEKAFAERHLAETNTALRVAEARLQTFLQTNREYRSSASLSLDEDRLAREVAMRQQLYTAAAQAYESAKMDQVRDTPVLTVLEPPRMPTSAAPRGLLKTIVLGVIVGTVLGGLVLLLRGPYETLREMMRSRPPISALRPTDSV